MNTKRYRDTFDEVRAPEGLTTEVLNMTVNSKTGVHTGRAARRVFVLAAVVVLLLALGVTAGAAGLLKRSDDSGAFLEQVLGLSGPKQEAYTLELAGGKLESYPSIERVSLDAEKAQELLGDYVFYSGESIECDDVKMTVEELYWDESGIGAMTLRFERPGGIEQQEGEWFDGRYGFYATLHDAKGWVVDEQSRITDRGEDWLQVVVPFTPFAEDGKTALEVTLHVINGNGQKQESIRLSVPERIPCRSFTDGSIHVEVSPVGLHLSGGAGSALESLTLHSVDGSEYLVIGENQVNYSVGSQREDARWFAFNRLSDTSALLSVRLRLRSGVGGEETLQSIVLTPVQP